MERREKRYRKSERNGANAIISVDFETSDMLQGTAPMHNNRKHPSRG
ncbi:MAG: YbjQ family protein [Candidatus Bathyarchaeota archaeon]|nr:YbjQ family protein [Candidatus Bathyarchaeota archaeon]